jgi:soluble lytic murein transglycosylase-like protein
MPGTLLQDDAEQMYAERLRQHAQSVWDTIANAPQQVTQAVQPAFQAASSAAQNIQPILPSIPQVDPNAVQSAQQALLQHAQDAWNSVQQAPQPQATVQAVDPTAANDAAQRLLQHANDTWQSVGQGLTSATAPVQQATQPVTQGLQQATSPTATSPVAQDQTTAAPTNAPEPDRSMSYQDYARAAARKAGIDPNVFMAQIQQESGFNPAARSPAGAIGIAQFMPATAAGVHLDPTDPYASLDAAAAEDAKRLQQYDGDWGKTLASYNAGAGAVAQYGGIPPYAETQTYVKTILGNAQKAADAAGTTIGNAVSAVRNAVAPAHAPSTPAQTDGTQIANTPNDAGQIFPLAVKPDNAPTATYHSEGGSDLMAPRGTPVLNMQSGKVAEVFTDNGSHTVGGNAVLIHGDDGLDYYYAHFDQPSAVKVGQRVGAGEQIGAVGNSGNAYKGGQGETHLHIGIGHGISNGVGSEGGLGENFNAQALLTTLENGVGQASGAGTPSTAVNPDVTARPTGAPSGPVDSAVQAVQQGWQGFTGGLQSASQALQDVNRLTPGTAAVQAAQDAVQNARQAVNAAGQTITDLGTGAQQAVSGAAGAAGAARTAAQQGAETLGQGLPDITGTLTPENIPLGGANTPLGKIAQGQKVTPVEQLEAAPQIGLGYEQSRSQAAANLDPLRNLPGGNVVGPTVEMLTDPASWVGVGSAKNAIGVAASVAASVAAQQVADNVIPDDDPNKGVKVAIVSLLGAFTGGPVGERTIAPLVDRANALVSGLGADGASLLVRRAADAAGDRVAPTVRQFTTEELGAAGRPAEIAAARAAQTGFQAPDTTRMFHGTGAAFPRVDPEAVSGEGNLFGPGYYLTSDPRVAGGVVRNAEVTPQPGDIESAWGNVLNPATNPDLQRGAVVSPGYAQAVKNDPTAALQATLNSYLRRKDAGGMSDRMAFMVDQEIDRLRTELANAPIPSSGPNVRPIDVPQDLNLLDMDKPVPQSVIENIDQNLSARGDFGPWMSDRFQEAIPGNGLETGEQVWRALVHTFEGSKADANEALAQLGYDGVSYAGGNRIPMTDEAGAPIQHQATVIFPESLDKVRNAVSGTQGGAVATPFAARLGGAAAGGAVGYQTTPEDASPQERALRTAGGAVAGYAGVAAASKVARALADILKPDLAAPQLEQAIKTVNETDATAPEIAAAMDQVRKMPGTAELAPVRQQVPQSSTDLLQAMLDAARARGADPEKLTALEQQITAMDPQAATRRGLSGFLTGEGSEAGSVSPRFGATLGGAVAGGFAGNATTPDDAMTLPTPLGDIPVERAARILAGAGIGAGLGSAAGFRGSIDQRVLESLRSSGVVAGPPTPAAPVGGLLSEAVQQSKQMLLTGPHTHISNVIGNTIELGRQPIALALGGRGDDALAAVTSVVKALPQAAGNALSLTRGLEPANLSQGANLVPRRYPIYRMLSAADAFTRTLGEYQGMSAKANQLLRDAGIAPSDPAAAAFLSSHAADLFQAGKERGAQSVFGQAGTAATARTGLEGVFRALGTYKDGLLASPNPVSKAVGAMLDFELPFSGVPVRMLSLVASRTPPGTQIRGISNIAKALGSGDTAAAQHALGEMAMESTIQFLIAQNVANGNIRGPDDVEHPNGIHLPGLGWVDTSEWGGYALPMQTMAAFAEGYQKGGTNMPEGAKGNDYLNYYGPRYAAAFNASMKPFLQAVPGMNMVRVLSTALQGNATDAGTRVAQDAVSRLTVPGMARFIENATDPSARDLAKKGPEAAWDTFLAGWPGLAQNLPVKIDPTTGEPMDKKKSGLGTLIGQQQDFASPLSIEADRLNKAGFKDVVAPTAYADGVTIGGSKVSLSPDEQREVAQITGSRLDQLAARMDSGEYQNAPDVRKAQMLKSIIADADKTRESAVTRVLGGAELRSRVLSGRQTAGQLRTQAEPPPPFDPLAFLRQQDQPAAAGVR